LAEINARRRLEGECARQAKSNRLPKKFEDVTSEAVLQQTGAEFPMHLDGTLDQRFG
jgi:hypothetical protein